MNFHNDDSSVKTRKDLIAASHSGQQTSDFIEWLRLRANLLQFFFDAGFQNEARSTDFCTLLLAENIRLS
jgi:hypothetical protein